MKEWMVAMTLKELSMMNHEIGIIQGIALGVENEMAADALMGAAETLEEIAKRLMEGVE